MNAKSFYTQNSYFFRNKMAFALTIEERYSSLNHYDLLMDREIRSQVGVQPLPFPGMDKSQAMMCELFQINKCQLGNQCCYRHIHADRNIVCKHWLRGLCKKGDNCEFLHQYDMSKMPVCYFYSNFGRCENRDCMYQHVNPDTAVPECPWYARGHCKHGSQCKKKHVRKVMCVDFMVGFCPAGPECEYEHPKWELPSIESSTQKVIRCHYGILLAKNVKIFSSKILFIKIFASSVTNLVIKVTSVKRIPTKVHKYRSACKTLTNLTSHQLLVKLPKN